MNAPYEYVSFNADDPCELPLQHFESLKEISLQYEKSVQNLSNMFRRSNIISVNENIKIERFRREK